MQLPLTNPNLSSITLPINLIIFSLLLPSFDDVRLSLDRRITCHGEQSLSLLILRAGKPINFISLFINICIICLPGGPYSIDWANDRYILAAYLSRHEEYTYTSIYDQIQAACMQASKHGRERKRT